MGTTPEEQDVIDAAKHHIYGPLSTAQQARDDLIRALAVYNYVKANSTPAPEAPEPDFDVRMSETTYANYQALVHCMNRIADTAPPTYNSRGMTPELWNAIQNGLEVTKLINETEVVR